MRSARGTERAGVWARLESIADQVLAACTVHSGPCQWRGCSGTHVGHGDDAHRCHLIAWLIELEEAGRLEYFGLLCTAADAEEARWLP